MYKIVNELKSLFFKTDDAEAKLDNLEQKIQVLKLRAKQECLKSKLAKCKDTPRQENSKILKEIENINRKLHKLPETRQNFEDIRSVEEAIRKSLSEKLVSYSLKNHLTRLF